VLAIALTAVWARPRLQVARPATWSSSESANVVREQLKSDQDPIPAQNLRPYYSPESPLPREDAVRLVADPEGSELVAWLAWVIEAILLGVGACGTACLWWKPRYWRFGVIAGVIAFTLTSHLYSLRQAVLGEAGSVGELGIRWSFLRRPLPKWIGKDTRIFFCRDAYSCLGHRLYAPAARRPQSKTPTSNLVLQVRFSANAMSAEGRVLPIVGASADGRRRTVCGRSRRERPVCAGQRPVTI